MTFVLDINFNFAFLCLCLWFRASLIYVDNFPTRCNTKHSIYYSASSRRIEAAEMKLLRPLAGYTFYDHKTNGYIRREIRITGILDKINEYRRNWLSHLQRMPQNHIPLKSYHYRPQGEQLEDRRSVGASGCNSGDGTDQRVQSLMFMMMMIMMMI